jgi:hypothetical protein
MVHIAYVAGLIDGEGTITIARQRRGSSPTWRYQPRLLVVNTDLRLIEAVRHALNVGIVYQSKADRTGAIPANWNPVHRFQATAQQAIYALKIVRPYLIAKAEHADIVLDMPTRSKNHRDTSAVAGQVAAFEAIARLNRRGR